MGDDDVGRGVSECEGVARDVEILVEDDPLREIVVVADLVGSGFF